MRLAVAVLLKHKELRPVNIVFCDDSMTVSLNREFRKKSYPADVLSFNFNEDDFLGEIYISADRVRSQADEYGVSFYEEALRLTAHGLLHLCGYKHNDKKSLEKMKNLENRFIENIK